MGVGICSYEVKAFGIGILSNKDAGQSTALILLITSSKLNAH